VIVLLQARHEATDTTTPDTQVLQRIFTNKLVAEPDQLIKMRGKSGLSVAVNKEWEETKKRVVDRTGK